MNAGSEDIEVGVPIMVTVEEEEDIAAFADFVLDEPAAPSPAEPEPEPEPEPAKVVEAVAPPAPPPAPPAPVEPTPVAATTAESTEPPEMEKMAVAIAPILSTGWGNFAKVNSPIIKTLSKQQNDYIEKYGTTGQLPLDQ